MFYLVAFLQKYNVLCVWWERGAGKRTEVVQREKSYSRGKLN